MYIRLALYSVIDWFILYNFFWNEYL